MPRQRFTAAGGCLHCRLGLSRKPRLQPLVTMLWHAGAPAAIADCKAATAGGMVTGAWG